MTKLSRDDLGERMAGGSAVNTAFVGQAANGLGDTMASFFGSPAVAPSGPAPDSAASLVTRGPALDMG
jgi:hypothetical protein